MSPVDPAVLLFANDAFYLAFNNRDMTQMSALWSEGAICSCIHPGWQPLVGREAVLESWAGIFESQDPSFQIACHGARVISLGDTYQVICFEELPGGWLVASNLFVVESGEPRLVSHQASQCMEPPDIDEPEDILQ